MARVVKAPNTYDYNDPIIFLAGSIDMGGAEDWQTRVAKELDTYDLTILNPRRDDWDSTWTQSIKNSQFREQVEWELMGQEDSEYLVVYFADDSKSPITLLELGLALGSGRFDKDNIAIYCSDKFYRKGNVDVTCRFYDVPVQETYEDFISKVRNMLDEPRGL